MGRCVVGLSERLRWIRRLNIAGPRAAGHNPAPSGHVGNTQTDRQTVSVSVCLYVCMYV